MIKTILFIDTETTGLSPESSDAIEVGAVLFSLVHNTVIAQCSTLVHSMIPSDEDALDTHGITNETIQGLEDIRYSEDLQSNALELIGSMGEAADIVVAHNCGFDKPFCEKLGLFVVDQIVWVDSLKFEWSKMRRIGARLSDVALKYGVSLWETHRALSDCQILASICQREPGIQDIIRRAMRPTGWAIALCPKDEPEIQSVLKSNGFRWGAFGEAPGHFAREFALEDHQTLNDELFDGQVIRTFDADKFHWYEAPIRYGDNESKAIVKNHGFRWMDENSPLQKSWSRQLLEEEAAGFPLKLRKLSR